MVLAGVAAVLMLPPAPARLTSDQPVLGRRGWVVLAAGAGLVSVLLLWTWLTAVRFVLVVLAAAVALVVLRMVRHRRAGRLADQRGESVLQVCEGMAADLAAGQPPLLALDRAALEWPELAPVAMAARMGADVPEFLRSLAVLPGASSLHVLAAAWQVAQHTGTGLADALGQVGRGIREERRTVRLISAELSSAHATARLLAVLPIGVLLIGSGVGGDPIGFLVGTPFGVGLLAAGVGLSLAGLWWLERIADGVVGR